MTREDPSQSAAETPNPSLASILTEGMTPENAGAYQLVADRLRVLAEEDKGSYSAGIYRKLHAGAVFDVIQKNDNDLGVTQENKELVKMLLNEVQRFIGANPIPIEEVRKAVQSTNQLVNFQKKLFYNDPTKQDIAVAIAREIGKMNSSISQQSMDSEESNNKIRDLKDTLTTKYSAQFVTENFSDTFDTIKAGIYSSLPKENKNSIPSLAYQNVIEGIIPTVQASVVEPTKNNTDSASFTSSETSRIDSDVSSLSSSSEPSVGERDEAKFIQNGNKSTLEQDSTGQDAPRAQAINMWKPDPSEFLALLKQGAVGKDATPADEAKQRLKQAARWYYTSAASCFNDQEECQDDFNEFRQYAVKTFKNEFKLPENAIQNILSWSGVTLPVQSITDDSVIGDPIDDSTSKPTSVYDQDLINAVGREVYDDLQTIPNLDMRVKATTTLKPNDPPPLMPRVVNARRMVGFMANKSFTSRLPGSLTGNKFTIAPGRGMNSEWAGSISMNKGRGTGQTLVQAALAMGLFNKTGSKVKFSLCGSPQELQNKFSAILDEIERYNLPLDKCKFSLPDGYECNNIADLKAALQNPNHPLSRAGNLFSGGPQSVRNALLLRVQAIENKTPKRDDKDIPNISMADSTRSQILSRTLADGLTAHNEQELKKQFKDMQPEALKEAIRSAINAMPRDENQRQQQKEALLRLVVASQTNDNTTNQLMGIDITGSMKAYENYAQHVAKINHAVKDTELQETLDNAEKGFRERSSIENMDPANLNKHNLMQISQRVEGYSVLAKRDPYTLTYVDSKTLQAAQEGGIKYIDKLDSKIDALQKEISQLESDVSNRTDLSRPRKQELNAKKAELTKLQKSQSTAVKTLTKCSEPLEYLARRSGQTFSIKDKISALSAAEKTNTALLNKKTIEKPLLDKKMAELNQEIATIKQEIKDDSSILPKYNDPRQARLKALESQQAMVSDKINLYDSAEKKLQIVMLSKKALTQDDRSHNASAETLRDLSDKYADHKDFTSDDFKNLPVLKKPDVKITVEPNNDPKKVDIVVTNNKQVEKFTVDKPVSARTLDEEVKKSIISQTQSSIANSPSLWENIQRMAVDSDKKAGVDCGAIELYSSSYWENNDGMTTIVEKYDEAQKASNNPSETDFYQKALDPSKTTTFGLVSKGTQLKNAGNKARTTFAEEHIDHNRNQQQKLSKRIQQFVAHHSVSPGPGGTKPVPQPPE